MEPRSIGVVPEARGPIKVPKPHLVPPLLLGAAQMEARTAGFLSGLFLAAWHVLLVGRERRASLSWEIFGA